MKKTAFIFGAGDYFGFPKLPDGAFIAAADGGFAVLREQGIMPNLAIGDFDSLGYVPNTPNTPATEVIALPEHKDETDIGAAIRILTERGFSNFHIFGGTGGRLDHTIGNIALLAGVSKNGGKAFIYGDKTVITAVTDGEMTFPETAAGTVSVFAFGGEASGVTLRGLLYPLEEATLLPEVPLGVSNRFTGQKSTVAVKSGTVLIMITGEGRLCADFCCP
ncbi:MAG: thiamine diphosphokinase [Ruminococcus sp.]|nr:thiamine diphosphokinase [Ruminococcus sp.]